ncbi:hypothetical protein AYI68_g6250 [Smittium mucronatum]|nr:hypothetical protein AYI68_g6250 [Smittium mucronatum]
MNPISILSRIHSLESKTDLIYSDPKLRDVYMSKFLSEAKDLFNANKNSNGEEQENWPEIVLHFKNRLQDLNIAHLALFVRVEPDYYSWDLSIRA